jgi:hypothetical protein
MLTGGRYIPQSALAAGFYGGVGDFYMGGPAAFSTRSPAYLNGFGTAVITGPTGISGTIFDIPNIGDPARLGQTDRVGRGLTGVDARTTQDRQTLQPPGEPDTTVSPTLKQAQDAKADAYNRLMQALKNAVDGVAGDDVKKAISDFQAAEAKVKELSGGR